LILYRNVKHKFSHIIFLALDTTKKPPIFNLSPTYSLGCDPSSSLRKESYWLNRGEK